MDFQHVCIIATCAIGTLAISGWNNILSDIILLSVGALFGHYYYKALDSHKHANTEASIK